MGFHRPAVDCRPMEDGSLLEVLYEAAEAVRDGLSRIDDLGLPGSRPGQYHLDLVADEAALGVLHRAGLNVLSEESGTTVGEGNGDQWAVLDPVDGSTNASKGLPIYSTSIGVLDSNGLVAGVVVNHASGVSYEAVRGQGARRDGVRIRASECKILSEAIVGISGYPDHHLGWAQFRAFGCASLELCAVAEGSLDAYLLVGGAQIRPWDYMAGLLICGEAGAVYSDLAGEDLLIRSSEARSPVAASTNVLLDALRSS